MAVKADATAPVPAKPAGTACTPRHLSVPLLLLAKTRRQTWALPWTACRRPAT